MLESTFGKESLGRATDDTTGDASRGGDEGERASIVVARAGDAGAQEGVSLQGGLWPGTPEQTGAAVEKADESDGDAEGAALVVVAVDRVAGRRDALVRGLGRHATRWRGVGGAIDLRDGSVALLLDLVSLVEATGGEGGRRDAGTR
jgi:hypothetical protein